MNDVVNPNSDGPSGDHRGGPPPTRRISRGMLGRQELMGHGRGE